MPGLHLQPRKMAAKEKPKASKRKGARSVTAARHATAAVRVVRHHHAKAAPVKVRRPVIIISRRKQAVSPAPIVVSKVEPVPEIATPAVEARPVMAPAAEVAPVAVPEVIAPTVSVPAAIPVIAPAPVVAQKDTLSSLQESGQLPAGAFEIVTREVNGKQVQMVRIRRSQLKKSVSVGKKLLFAAVPGFFGLMGLSQIYQGRKVTGFAFFLSGAIVSFLSSWFLIIPSRIDAALTHGTFLPAYSLSLFSSLNVSASLASKLSMDLLGLVAVLWAVQLFDAMGPFVGRQTMETLTASNGRKVSVSFPGIRRAIVSAPSTPFKSSSESKSAAGVNSSNINQSKN